MKATYIVNQESVLTALMTMLKANWKQFFDKGKALEVNVSIHKDSRTLRQNAHQHWLYQRIAEQAWVDGKQHEMVVLMIVLMKLTRLSVASNKKLSRNA
jgi:hypothetical protein